jgi:hypothetical protein
MQLLAARISHAALARGQALTRKTTRATVNDVWKESFEQHRDRSTTRAIFLFDSLFSFLLSDAMQRSIKLKPCS